MFFFTILVALAPLCLAKPFDAEEVKAMFETLQVGHKRNMVLYNCWLNGYRYTINFPDYCRMIVTSVTRLWICCMIVTSVTRLWIWNANMAMIYS